MDSIEIHAEVSRMLESVCEPDSKNRFTAFEVRDHAVEFLTDYDSEIERFPELAASTHFEFIMADYDLSRDAVFVAYLFGPQVLELVGGRGEAFSLRSFVEHELPEDTDAAAIRCAAARGFRPHRYRCRGVWRSRGSDEIGDER